MRQEWFNPSNARRYWIELFEDLLGDWILIRHWSGRHRPGNYKRALLPSYAQAMQQVTALERQRRRRGYHRVG